MDIIRKALNPSMITKSNTNSAIDLAEKKLLISITNSQLKLKQITIVLDKINLLQSVRTPDNIRIWNYRNDFLKLM